VLLRHVSALKGPSLVSTSDTIPQQDQQHEPNVKFSLVSSVCCVSNISEGNEQDKKYSVQYTGVIHESKPTKCTH
jgi:hypothetical protein